MDEKEKPFYESLDTDERFVFNLFNDVRNGTVSPIDAFQKVRDLALAESVV